MKYRVDGLRTVMHELREWFIDDRLRVRHVHFVPDDGLVTSIVVASAVLVEAGAGQWVLQYIIVDDENRRKGWCEKIVQAMEAEHGVIGACWCSSAAAAFARRYIEKWGPRPTWERGARLDLLDNGVIDRSKVVR